MLARKILRHGRPGNQALRRGCRARRLSSVTQYWAEHRLRIRRDARFGRHRKADLRRDDNLCAVRTQCRAEYALAVALTIDICSVEKIDSEVKRKADQSFCFGRRDRRLDRADPAQAESNSRNRHSAPRQSLFWNHARHFEKSIACPKRMSMRSTATCYPFLRQQARSRSSVMFVVRACNPWAIALHHGLLHRSSPQPTRRAPCRSRAPGSRCLPSSERTGCILP